MSNLSSKLFAGILALSTPGLVAAEELQEIFDGPAPILTPEDYEVAEELETPNLESREDYHFTAVGGIASPLPLTPDPVTPLGYVAPLVSMKFYTELGNSPLDLLGTITTSESNLELMLRTPNGVNFSIVPTIRYLVHGDHLHYIPDGSRDKDQETSASEFGGRLHFETDPENVLSGSIDHEFFWKVYGWPAAPESGEFPDDHFLHRTKGRVQVNMLGHEDQSLNLKDGVLANIMAVYEARPGFTSNVEGMEDNKHTIQLGGMLGWYFRSGFFDLQTELRAMGSFGADRFNTEYQGSYLSEFGPGPGMFYKEHSHSQSVQGNIRLGFLISGKAGSYHVQPGFGMLVLPGESRVEGAEKVEGQTLPYVELRTDMLIANKLPVGFRVAYSPLSVRSEDTLGSLEVLFYVAIGLGKTSE